jgi:hypothetical protein
VTVAHRQSVEIGVCSSSRMQLDADLFAPGSTARSALKKYRFVDWGLFEHFLTGLAQLHAGRRLNLWASAPVVKFGNDRAAGKETPSYFQRAWARNYVSMRSFLDHHALGDDLLRLHDCHTRFELVGRARCSGLNRGWPLTGKGVAA